MNYKQFLQVLDHAITWDSCADERFNYPEMDEEETELFEHFLNLFQDTEKMNQLAFIAGYKELDRSMDDAAII